MTTGQEKQVALDKFKSDYEEPMGYYERMQNIQNSMEYSVHQMIYKHGKKSKTKEGTRYTIKLTHNDRVIVVNDGGWNTYLSKVVINNPEQCQRMAHIILYDEKGEQVTLGSYQWFNVYSGIYHKIEGLIKRGVNVPSRDLFENWNKNNK